MSVRYNPGTEEERNVSMKKILVFVFVAILTLPLLTGCLLAGLFLVDDTSSVEEIIPEFAEPINALDVMMIDIFDWYVMDESQQLKWASDVIAIWQQYGDGMNVTAETLLTDVTAALELDNEQANIFEVACATQGIDASIYNAPPQDNSDIVQEENGGTQATLDIEAALNADIFDWQLMSEDEKQNLMFTYLLVWDINGITCELTDEELLTEVSHALARDSEQANIFEVACATQGLDPNDFRPD